MLNMIKEKLLMEYFLTELLSRINVICIGQNALLN